MPSWMGRLEAHNELFRILILLVQLAALRCLAVKMPPTNHAFIQPVLVDTTIMSTILSKALYMWVLEMLWLSYKYKEGWLPTLELSQSLFLPSSAPTAVVATTKLGWQSVSRGWEHAIQSHQVYYGRVQSHSTDIGSDESISFQKLTVRACGFRQRQIFESASPTFLSRENQVRASK